MFILTAWKNRPRQAPGDAGWFRLFGRCSSPAWKTKSLTEIAHAQAGVKTGLITCRYSESPLKTYEKAPPDGNPYLFAAKADFLYPGCRSVRFTADAAPRNGPDFRRRRTGDLRTGPSLHFQLWSQGLQRHGPGLVDRSGQAGDHVFRHPTRSGGIRRRKLEIHSSRKIGATGAFVGHRFNREDLHRGGGRLRLSPAGCIR